MKEFDQRSKTNLAGVHPNLIKVLQDAYQNISFVITYGVRTEKQQQELYAQGRTKPGPIVTNCDGIKNKSNHQKKADGFGHAIDFVPDTNNDKKVQANELNIVTGYKPVVDEIKKSAAKLGIKLSCGIDWKSIDPAHIEIV